MYQQISRGEFRDAFKRMGREYNFGYHGLNALYDFLEEHEGAEEYELDVVELCCDFTQDTIENTLKEHNLESLDDLRDHTVVIWNDETDVLFANY